MVDPGELFPVMQNGKYGYINKNGEIKINPQFDHQSIFSDGIATAIFGDNGDI